jgi:putative tryptophan/tyrosine transport system substrate-binding protein
MNRKILGFVVITVTLASVNLVEAQQQAKIPRVGFVSGGDPTLVEAFRQGLRDLGYVEGKNIFVEERHGGEKPDWVAHLVAELVQLKVDVLVSGYFPAIRAAKQATTTIPVVVITAQDPVGTGLVDSLARPGGNITGLTLLTRELSGKRLELLKEVVPKLSRVGVLWGVRTHQARLLVLRSMRLRRAQ